MVRDVVGVSMTFVESCQRYSSCITVGKIKHYCDSTSVTFKDILPFLFVVVFLKNLYI